jgi:hypothetical protein
VFIPELLTDLAVFIRALLRRWQAYMTGGLVIALVALWEHYARKSVAGSLFGWGAIGFLAVAVFLTWRAEHRTAKSANQQMMDFQKARPIFVMRECCRSNPSLAIIGVANLNPKTVRNALVYIDIAALQITDRVLAWAGQEADEGLDLHQGPISRHHHTFWFASVGDNAGQYFVHTAYGNHQVEAGKYVAELCVKGEDTMAATARVEIVFAPSRSLTVRLLPGGDAE